MDVDYRRIGAAGGQSIYTDFHTSLTALATVVSNTHSDRVTIDAGTKAIDTTTTSLPQVVNRAAENGRATPSFELVYSRFGDEFGALMAEGGRLPALGDRVELIVPHCD